ncbi:dipeptidase [Acholeplasma hippikon]|uniref:Membrane dipeptidase (Peptidase family M19) n=1 Tax=Acholeplasma hippikon TaxID=264636 RepID=A0A449BIY8_9MOLU|nr:membrane dipeptidase [Acholeplasma hippikon]VEU82402.1 Membrane dipeptidase (Peptidase family M19) [Acholeplasma hippikon]
MEHKIFDIHTDVIYDIYTHVKEGNLTRFEDIHANQYNQSIVKAAVWTLYSPNDFDLLDAYQSALNHIDFKLIKDFKVILGLEGLRNLKDLNEFKMLYNLGVRHAMLTWNEENKYATGVFGNPDRGLTKAGFEVLDFMIEHDMIIDLSHLSDKSFYEVVNYTSKNLVVSHSNVRNLCNHPRNLTDDQLKLLKEKDALVGLTNVPKFIAEDIKDRNLDKFIEHIKYVVKIMGIDNVCLGFDFMDYFNPNVISNLNEIPNVTKAHVLINALKENEFNDEDIEKITYKNFYKRYNKHILKK